MFWPRPPAQFHLLPLCPSSTIHNLEPLCQYTEHKECLLPQRKYAQSPHKAKCFLASRSHIKSHLLRNGSLTTLSKSGLSYYSLILCTYLLAFITIYIIYCQSSQLASKYENSVITDSKSVFSLLYHQCLKKCQKQSRYNMELVSATKGSPKIPVLRYLGY